MLAPLLIDRVNVSPASLTPLILKVTVLNPRSGISNGVDELYCFVGDVALRKRPLTSPVPPFGPISSTPLRARVFEVRAAPAEDRRGQRAPSPAAAPAPSNALHPAEERLMLLKRLWERGLITEEEYAAKRKEIIDEL